MDKIKVSIVNAIGEEVVDSNKLTAQIPKGSLTIDGTKLYGSDNFIIDACRLKCQVKLINGSSINSQLIDILGNKDLLIDDNIETETFQCISISKDDVLREFSFESLFYRHFNSLPQTWDNDNNGILYIQSISMLNILLHLFKNYQLNQTKESIHKFTAMMNKIIANVWNIGHGTNIQKCSMPEHITYFLNEKMKWTTFSDSGNLSFYLYKLICYEYISTTIFGIAPDYLREIARYVYENVTITEFQYINTIGQTVTIANNINPYPSAVWNDTIVKNIIVYFFSSLISHTDYITLVNEYVRNLYTPSSIYRESYGDIWIGRNDYYTPFYQVNSIIMSSNGGINKFGEIISNSFSNISFCKKNQSINRKLQFGKIQTLSTAVSGELETESGIPITQIGDSGIYSGFFIPVERVFKLRASEYLPQISNDEYKFYLDSVNMNNIQSNDSCFLVTGGFSNTNWMYFDSIVAQETVLSIDEETLVDNIPVYDEDIIDNTDQYGLYVYADFFNKFYTKTKSNLMDLYVIVKVNETEIYRGIIDYTTISRDFKNSVLSFEATDAIGVLIENLKKLESFISFSQFDTGDMITAEPRAGSTIKQLLETIINNPIPYSTALKGGFDVDLSLVEGINNKALQEISAEDAFIIGMQMSKKMLSVNQETGKIQMTSIDEDASPIVIDDANIIALEYNQDVGGDIFKIDKLKNIAGFDRIAPSIAGYFNSVMLKYRKSITLSVRMSNSAISILDKITVKGKNYIVMSKEFDIMNKQISLQAVQVD